ncbi:hypothetical protein A9Q84_18680 [Halobacteriovorax marinus]|uniref:Outer membrane protein n=1 Tax=Halobacteriovorax marinus TaxID=97084 RepID=A0A1Y5F622_9BACT|nr:hypothetical protein A9Q84_18680 [Halobacteriovorax marinus]
MTKLNLIILVSLISLNSFADSTKTNQIVSTPKEKSSWSSSIGVAAITNSKIYQGAKAKSMAIPLITIKKGNFSFEGDKFVYKFLKLGNFTFATNLGYQAKPYKRKDSTILQGMEEKKNGALAYLTTKYKFKSYGVESSIGRVLGQSEQGLQATLEANYNQFYPTFLGGMLSLKYSLGVDYMDSTRALYVYGVKTSEVNIALGRSAYNVGQTLSPVAKFNTVYIFGAERQWMLLNNFSYQLLDSKIVDSPIVEEDQVLGFMTGLIRKF